MIYPCFQKDPATGAITLVGGYNAITGLPLTVAEVQAAMSVPCPKFDTERYKVCYDDGNGNLFEGGTKVEVFEINPSTGIPNLTPVSEALYDVTGTDITATGAVSSCPLIPETDPKEVCVDTAADGIGDTQGFLHFQYTWNPTTQIVDISTVVTDTSGAALVGVVVPCPEFILGDPITSCQ